jgi:hypothetical protein
MVTNSLDDSEAATKRPAGRHDDPRRKFDRAVCGTAAFDITQFRKRAAVNIFVHLRQMKPDLKPWKWNQGTWPTNSMLPVGTLLGGVFHHAKPVVAFEDSTTSLVELRKCYMTWFCAACEMDHRLNIPLSTLTLLDAGLLDREGWASYMNGMSRDLPIVMTIAAKPSSLYQAIE